MTDSRSDVLLKGDQSGSTIHLASSPHLHSKWTTAQMMWLVLIALIPAVISAIVFFGFRALLLLISTTAGACLCEMLVNKWRGLRFSLRDGSAVLTGILLGLILPPSFPILMAFLGGLVSIGLGKAVFGGLGGNIFNPALVGRAFLQAAFPVAMTTWTLNKLSDAVSTATPLGAVKFREAELAISEVASPLADIFWGNCGGSIGETSAVALLIGGVLLLVTKVANWRIPLAMTVGCVMFSGILWLSDSATYISPLYHILGGGFLLGAFFMATDLVTSPITSRGMYIFGFGIGFLTVLIRTFGGLPEGVMYSILLMNAAVPLINRWTVPKIFGVTR
jgi:Na+-translocating ferredoxin:NAD+ oxidoreductase subunit D